MSGQKCKNQNKILFQKKRKKEGERKIQGKLKIYTTNNRENKRNDLCVDS